MFKRYACVRQQDQSDCGVAALATIALHYKLRVKLHKLRDVAGTDRVGTNLLGLVMAAEKLGFSGQGVQAEYHELTPEHVPALVHLPAVAHIVHKEGFHHFIVVHKATQKYVIIADPAGGVEKWTKEEFCKRWTGYMALLTPDYQRLSVEAVGQAVSPWKRFFALVRPNMPTLLEAFFSAMVLTGLGMLSSFFVQHLVDSILVHNERRLLNALGIGMGIVLVFRVMIGVFRGYLLAFLARRVDLSLISNYTSHLLRLPMNFFEMRKTGDLLSRVYDASKIREALSGATLTTLVDGTLLAVSTLIMFLYDWQLALVACLFIPMLVGFVMFFHRPVQRRSRLAMEDAAILQSHLVEDATGIDTIKAYRLENARGDGAERKLVNFVQDVFALQKFGMILNAASMLITGVSVLIILWYGSHRVMDGALTIGQLMFFNMLMANVLGPVERLAILSLEFEDAVIAIDRLYEYLDVEQEGKKDDNALTFGGIKDALVLDKATFRYGYRANVLDNVNMRIPAGKTIAVVGESGSGKTTLLKLLMRFYDPVEGRILADGRDLREFSLESLRAKIGIVSQDPFIFNGTLMENISLGRPEAKKDEILDAAKVAGLSDFISELPQGYETMIGERGVKLSGGQKQRIAIARALLVDPRILILDEATSNLDAGSEALVQEALARLMKGRTTLVVAHRLSTVRDADRIVVLDGGRVAERGRHAELMARGGIYKRLVEHQVITDEPDPARAPALDDDAPDAA